MHIGHAHQVCYGELTSIRQQNLSFNEEPFEKRKRTLNQKYELLGYCTEVSDRQLWQQRRCRYRSLQEPRIIRLTGQSLIFLQNIKNKHQLRAMLFTYFSGFHSSCPMRNSLRKGCFIRCRVFNFVIFSARWKRSARLSRILFLNGCRFVFWICEMWSLSFAFKT